MSDSHTLFSYLVMQTQIVIQGESRASLRRALAPSVEPPCIERDCSSIRIPLIAGELRLNGGLWSYHCRCLNFKIDYNTKVEGMSTNVLSISYRLGRYWP